MSRLFEDKLRKIEPYVPGEQPAVKNIIKLNTNECPYPPSPKVKDFIKNFDTDRLRLYPSFICPELKAVLCDIYGINEGQLFLGNGSDEVLALCFMAFFNGNKKVLFPDVTYSFYDVWADLYRVPFEKVPLKDDFTIDINDYFKENGGVVIANPNAPTGIAMSVSEIEKIIENNKDCIVIIDEAYIDFGGISAVGLINKYDNLVVVQTFSKSRALAGIRVGYAMAQKELINVLEAVKNSFNSYTLSTFNQLAAAQCAKDTEYFNKCIGKIKNTRENTINQLKLLGFKTLPSAANFIFTTNPKIKAKEIFEYLKTKNIIVRYFNKDRISEYLRITIGTDYEMGVLIDEIKKFIADRKLDNEG